MRTLGLRRVAEAEVATIDRAARSYLEAYAAHHRLDIRFGVSVERLDRGPDGWRIRTSDGDLTISQNSS